MTVTREQIQDALDALGEMKKYAKSNDDNKFHHYDKINELEQTIRTVLQSALDGMDADETKYTFGENHAADAIKYMVDGKGMTPSQFRKQHSQTPDTAALDALLKLSEFCTLSTHETCTLRETIRAALTRPSVGWSDDIRAAPRNERILMVIDGHVKIAKFEHYDRMWVVFHCDDSWYQEEYDETYPTAWKPLDQPPAAPKGGDA